MFSSKNQLLKHTPESGTDRESFLNLLVDEYLHSSSFDAKCQVLANLANFAYDPINFQYIRDVGVLDIFLHVIKNEQNHQLLHYAVAGVCNLSCDEANTDYIISQCGIKPLISLLKINDSDICADVITCFIQLNNCQQVRSEITNEEVLKIICDIQNSDDKRLKNIATICLQDICGTNELNE